VQIHTSGNDEISVMSAALEEFVEIMREVIGDIRDISDQLSEQSDTSKAVSQTLHETATAQTDSSGDMQITMEQITDSVCDLAENAAYLLEVINDTAAIGERAEEVFLDVSATVPEELSVQLGELGAAFDEMLTKIHSVTDVAVSLADLSEEQSASAEEVLASTTLLAEASLRLAKEGTRVSECADIVSASAFTLAEHMRKFKL
nr:methyl-accepting chemotaxis protein [Lachnospiraceae bacterium]